MTRLDSEILEVVGVLHDAVVDDKLWEAAIGRFCQMLGTTRLLMGTISDGGRSVGFGFGHRATTEAVARLEGPLADPRHNPWLTLSSGHPLRRVATVDEVGGLDHLKSTRMWTDFYLPFDIGDTLGAAVERQPEYSNVLVVAKKMGKPDFSRRDRQLMQHLLPHLARAWRVRRAIAQMEAQLASLRLALDHIERAVIVTDPDGRIRFANAAADRLLTRGDAIDAANGRLQAKSARDTAGLRELIGRAAETAMGAESVAVDAVALPSHAERPSLAVVAEPLAPAHSDHLGHRADGGAILFIGDSQATSSPAEDRIRVVYGLTVAEARMVVQLFAGEGVAAAASALNVSENTAKYHLKSAYGKIGVKSQAQLVRRVLADVGGLAEPEKLSPQPRAAQLQ